MAGCYYYIKKEIVDYRAVQKLQYPQSMPEKSLKKESAI
jgi:hypothetical protein